MATSKDYMAFITEQLSLLDSITIRSMMGEYIIYYRAKIAAYVCDGRLLVKNVAAARRLLPTAPLEAPYEGAKEMLLVTNLDDREFLARLFEEMYDSLPAPKKR